MRAAAPGGGKVATPHALLPSLPPSFDKVCGWTFTRRINIFDDYHHVIVPINEGKYEGKHRQGMHWTCVALLSPSLARPPSRTAAMLPAWYTSTS